MDEAHVRLVPYIGRDLYKAKGWNGMISPEGEFYKIHEKNSLETGHDVWVESFLKIKRKTDIKEKLRLLALKNPKFATMNYKDAIVHVYGFINYEYSSSGVDIKPPKYNYTGKKVTIQQLETVKELLLLNKDRDDNIYQLFKETEKVPQK